MAQPPKTSLLDMITRAIGLPTLGGSAAPATGTIQMGPAGSASPGVYTGVPGTGPGTAVVPVRGGPVATIPRAVGPYTGGGARPPAASSMAAGAARGGAGALIRKAVAPTLALGYLADGVGDVIDDANNPDSMLRRRAQAAVGQAALAEQQGLPRAQQIGSKVRNAAAVVKEGAKSLLLPNDTMDFMKGLFGGGEAAAPVQKYPATVIDGRATAPAPAAASAAPAAGKAASIDDYLQINQLVPLLQALPSAPSGKAGPQGKDLLYEQVGEALYKQMQAGMNAPGADNVSRSRLLDRYLEQMQMVLGTDPMAMMQFTAREDE
jgi:hypothetical protein